MTVIRPNSISGINSITGQGGDISIFRADGTAADVTVNNITSGIITATTFSGTTGTFTGNLGVGGVLTYEDVTNIDSVGVITARSGIRIGATGANTLLTGNSTRIDVGNHIRITGGTDHDIEFQKGSGRRKFVGGDGNELELGSYSSSNSSRDIFLQIASNGNITANTGNLVIGTAGKGIDYSAQTPTAVSGATATGEVFDHYEEGTWTATLGNVNAPTYEAQGGVYTRIGRMVFCDCTIGVASGLDTSDGSGFQIRGLPFTGSTTGGTVCLFSLGRYTNLLGGKSTSVRNVRFLGDGVILQEGNDSDIAYNECSSSGYLQISFAYMMA